MSMNGCIPGISLKEQRKLQQEVYAPNITRNTVLSNGWLAGYFCLQLIWYQKQKRRSFEHEKQRTTLSRKRAVDDPEGPEGTEGTEGLEGTDDSGDDDASDAFDHVEI